MSSYFSIRIAKSYLENGDVIAYPTEAVFGIGCSPSDNNAIRKVLSAKKRNVEKGLILIGHDFNVFEEYVQFSQFSVEELNFMKKYWPGPYTFIVPCRPNVSQLITGKHESVAIRITEHPIVRSLCEMLNKPLISTSANISGQNPCLTYEDAQEKIGDLVDYVVYGSTLGYLKPSTIIDLKTRKYIRG